MGLRLVSVSLFGGVLLLIIDIRSSTSRCYAGNVQNDGTGITLRQFLQECGYALLDDVKVYCNGVLLVDAQLSLGMFDVFTDASKLNLFVDYKDVWFISLPSFEIKSVDQAAEIMRFFYQMGWGFTLDVRDDVFKFTRV